MVLKNNKNRIIIFGRYPVPGSTKTRLIPELGRAGAAEVQRQLTEKTVSTVRRISCPEKCEIEFCFDGDSFRKMREWIGPGIKLSS